MVLAPTISNNEHNMIYASHFAIRFLPTGRGTSLANDYLAVLVCAIQVTSALVLTVLAHVLPWYLSVLCVACVALILFFRVLTLAFFAITVVKGKYTKPFYRKSVLYWGWWPVWLCIWSAIAVVIGILIGDYLWRENLKPYLGMAKLQAYKELDTAKIPSQRVQDAGLVEFARFNWPDRSKGGCFMNAGDTYCVTPIVPKGEVDYGVVGLPNHGSYDYFAVGKNCCPCPNKDFQCGAWQNPMANGGIRSLDEKARPFYKLALEDWEASYGKKSRDPLFFDWVQDPEWVWKGMWNRVLELGWLTAAFAVAMGLTVGFLGEKLLTVLWQQDIVSPRTAFAPAPGLAKVIELLMPKMYYRYQDEQQQLLSMPVSAQWAEDPRVLPDGSNTGETGYGSMAKGDVDANRGTAYYTSEDFGMMGSGMMAPPTMPPSGWPMPESGPMPPTMGGIPPPPPAPFFYGSGMSDLPQAGFRNSGDVGMMGGGMMAPPTMPPSAWPMAENGPRIM